MDSQQYEQLLEQLVAGEISEITVTPESFMAFRAAWSKRSDRKSIVGEAGLYGKILYTFQKVSD
ncbi:hypothetical protein [Vagococcus humatus]|uniref:Uncharacterized protein n=1 Tax=Vagococcus humatus TaxID=1889241 RepID=A0A429Z8C5_9ENTE|nr:hypothetical protein [Vagococcus humatus]RST89941.1 hypothetical protein C7P63_02365 [Vagococcus humatus]